MKLTPLQKRAQRKSRNNTAAPSNEPQTKLT